MVNRSELQGCPPNELVGARTMAHRATQLIGRAALANLEPAPDYSHASLVWDKGREAFLSQPLPGPDAEVFVGLAIADLKLLVIAGGQTLASLDLADVADDDACTWLDGQLGDAGLKPASPVAMTSDLPPAVKEVGVYSMDGLERALATLNAWFAFADGLLVDFAAGQSGIQPGPSAVWCWPHHFDIATYVGLETGDPETARGIGVGLSPGDEIYQQPYFYISPFPQPAVDDLPDPPSPGHWHSQGFVGAIATGDEVLTLADVETGTAEFIMEAFQIGRRNLGI